MSVPLNSFAMYLLVCLCGSLSLSFPPFFVWVLSKNTINIIRFWHIFSHVCRDSIGFLNYSYYRNMFQWDSLIRTIDVGWTVPKYSTHRFFNARICCDKNLLPTWYDFVSFHSVAAKYSFEPLRRRRTKNKKVKHTLVHNDNNFGWCTEILQSHTQKIRRNYLFSVETLIYKLGLRQNQKDFCIVSFISYFSYVNHIVYLFYRVRIAL